MFSLQSLLRPHLLTLTPYSSARDEYTGKVGVFLDANENALGSALSRGALDGATLYSRYPDPHQLAIKERLAPLKGVRPEQIFLGNGSDEPIDLLIRAFCEPIQTWSGLARPGLAGPVHDRILILPPTYGMYEVSATVNNVGITRVPLTPSFQVDLPAVLAAMQPTDDQPDPKLVWICSPNNPSGNLIDPSAIRAILDAATQSLVVVDEAYIDFAEAPSWVAQLDAYPNLVVLQTFSKAWGLAALRLGMCFGSAELVALLNKIKPPYNISAPTQQLALNALGQVTLKNAFVATLNTERQFLAEQLAALPQVQQIYPSDANFLLVRFQNAQATFEQLIQQQVIVRDRSRVQRCAGCLRITVGTRTENERLLAVLAEIGQSS